MPSCEDKWKVVAIDFGHRWNFYNCIGAMDGKHFKINPPFTTLIHHHYIITIKTTFLLFYCCVTVVYNLDLYMMLVQMAE